MTGTFAEFMKSAKDESRDEGRKEGRKDHAKEAIDTMLESGYPESEVRRLFSKMDSPKFVDRIINEWKAAAGSPAAV